MILRPSGKLIRLEEARQLIAEAKTIEDAVEIRDRAQLLLHAIRDRDLNSEMALDVAEMKVRAERRVGELLAEMPKRHGARPADAGSHDVTPISSSVGKMESSRSQAIAALPEAAFEAKIAEGRKAGEITTSAVLKEAKTHQRKEKQKAPLAAAEGRPMPEAARVIVGDLVEQLPQMEAGSVRLAFADPPYNVGVEYGDGVDDLLPDEEYVAWCASWFALLHRALADDGTFWLLVGDEYADYLGVELRRAGFHRRAWVKWYETFGVCNSARTNFSRNSRHLFYCVKNPRRFTWNPEAVSRPSDRQTKYDDARADPDGKVWDDVWQISRLAGTFGERIDGFPTQLPTALLEPIVGATSMPGDLVADPFCGSGTAGVVALRTGRRFVGIEKQENFARLATQRLKGVRDGEKA